MSVAEDLEQPHSLCVLRSPPRTGAQQRSLRHFTVYLPTSPPVSGTRRFSECALSGRVGRSSTRCISAAEFHLEHEETRGFGMAAVEATSAASDGVKLWEGRVS